MGIRDRLKFNMFRKRGHQRANKQRMMLLLKITCIVLTVGLITTVLAVSLMTMYKEYKVDRAAKVETVKDTPKASTEDRSLAENKGTIKDVSKLENETSAKVFNITIVGDIMMGKISSDDKDASYMLPFKNVAEYTKKADYTVCNLTTNISNLDKIEDARSKYIVTKSILNAFNTLGVDGVNIATDHMLDFGSTQFNTTVSILKQANLTVIGLSKDIVYAEKDGIRVAFISLNNVVIGTKNNYILAGINVYDKTKNKALITEAKSNADVVIAMPHYGKENTHIVSDAMKIVARGLIDSGADMVIGSHSLGIYPVEEYKGKQIIYSSGYFMHDTSYEIGKQSAIFNISVNEKGQITKTEVLPVYIGNGKEIKLYTDIDKKDSKDYLNKLFVTTTFDKYSIQNKQDRLVISLKSK